MPNWCYNDLTLTTEDVSKADDLENFLKSLDESENETTGIFNYFLPRPKEQDKNWYDWNITNWGTKWDAKNIYWSRDENTFSLNFDTAWSPPISLYEYIYDNGDWDIYAMYEEPGMCFVGLFSDGSNEEYNYDFDEDDCLKDIPEDLIDFAGLDYSYESYLEEKEEFG